MGCGCGGQSTVQKKVTLSKCPELYEVLRSLDLRVINLLNQNLEPILKETNKQLRMWMRNLHSYCPNEEELEIVRSFVESKELE